jgi:hypothetical protein
MVKVFDLRMMRQLPPCSFFAGHGGAPSLLHFFPSFSSHVVAASEGGGIGFLDARGDGSDTTYLQVKAFISL